MAFLRSEARFWPLITMLPEVGRSIAASSLKRVDFPAPEWPVRNTISPAVISKLTFLSASRPSG